MKSYRWKYAVVDSQGAPGQCFPLQTSWGTYLPGVAMSAAEDFNLRPESDGAPWPLTFVIFSDSGKELGRLQVKRWYVPHFFTVATDKPVDWRECLV